MMGWTGRAPDDAIVVLQTLTVQFGGTVKLLAKTTEAMTLLGDDDLIISFDGTYSAK